MTFRRTLSVDVYPELLDHAFFRQPESCPSVEDAYPVVPMSGLVHLMMDAATSLVPGGVVVGVEEIHARRWLCVAPAAEISMNCRFDGDARLEVELDGYAKGCVLLDSRYATAPRLERLLRGYQERVPVTPAELYANHWLFHGPAYQGMTSLDEMTNCGIRGRIKCGSALGAVLDNAAQIAGCWLLLHEATNRLAMPVRIRRVRFFADPPSLRAALECRAVVTHSSSEAIVFDIDVVDGHRLWARLEGYECRRFQTDEALWRVVTWPEKNTLSKMDPSRTAVFENRYASGFTREYIMRRYFQESERSEAHARNPRVLREWFSARIAAKDAVRAYLWQRGEGPVFPSAVRFSEGDGGELVASEPLQGLAVRATHRTGGAIAHVLQTGTQRSLTTS